MFMPRNCLGFVCTVSLNRSRKMQRSLSAFKLPEGFCHPAVVHVAYEINSLVVVVLLEKIAGVELTLRESFHLDKLLFGRVVPDAPGIRLAVEWLEQLLDDWYSAIVEVALVGRGGDVHFSVVSCEGTLE
eukprot:4949085-Pleurochrysis_carterae.AAC.1